MKCNLCVYVHRCVCVCKRQRQWGGGADEGGADEGGGRRRIV